MNVKVQEICAQLLPATVNGVYQGIVISLVVAGMLRLIVRTNAATRHAIWFACLLLIVLIIPAHYWLDSGPVAPPADSGPPAELADAASETGSLGSADTTLTGVDIDPERGQGNLVAEADAEPRQARSSTEMVERLSVPPAASVADGSELPASERSLEANAPGPFWGSVRRSTWPAIQAALKPVHWRVNSPAAFPVAATLLISWVTLAGAQLVFIGLKLRRLLQLREQTVAPEPVLQALFDKLKAEAGVRRSVELRVSQARRCPMLVGFLRPFILLPEGIGQGSPEEIEQVLRHELAHAARWDDWANLVQHLAQSVLFFHPSIWWINRKLSLEREIACDDQVLQQCVRRQDYALTLTNVASRLRQPTPLLAPGVSNSSSQLQQRIHMILNTRRDASPRLAKGRTILTISTAALVAIFAASSGPRFILSAAPAPAPAPHPVISIETADVSVTTAPVVRVSEAVALDTSDSYLIAQSEPAPVVSVGVNPGPKFKPEPGAGDEPSEPTATIAAPEPPDAANFAPPAKPRGPRAARAPRVRAQAGDDEKDNEGSIENRLRRLEKMVHELMDQQGMKRSHMEFAFKDEAARNLNVDQQQLDKMKLAAERQAARAQEQAERAAEQMKRSNRELEARLEQDNPGGADYHEAFQRQIEALQKAREGLNKEMERINRQIEKLQKEQQRKEKEPKRRGEPDADKEAPEPPVVPAPVK